MISSDKGLCGGIHSSVSKATRRAINNQDDCASVMVIGDKSKAQLSGALPFNMQLTFNEIDRDIPTFADLITQSGVKYDSVVVVYNKFLNIISYEAATVEVKGADTLKESSAYLNL